LLSVYRFYFNEVPVAILQFGEMMKKNSVWSGLSLDCSGGPPLHAGKDSVSLFFPQNQAI
jgi:hypothetical protein